MHDCLQIHPHAPRFNSKNQAMIYKLTLALSSSLLTTTDAHVSPSSLLQIGASAKTEATTTDSILASIQDQVKQFKAKMDQEIADDREQVRKLKDQQRQMQREEKVFKSKIFAKKFPIGPSSFAQTNTHFGDPYIDEAMRTISDDIDAQKREMDRLLATHHAAPAESMIEQKRPDLGVIAAALRTRMNLVGK